MLRLWFCQCLYVCGIFLVVPDQRPIRSDVVCVWTLGLFRFFLLKRLGSWRISIRVSMIMRLDTEMTGQYLSPPLLLATSLWRGIAALLL